MIIDPKPGLTGIIDEPQISGMLSTPATRYYFGWEFTVNNCDILITKFRWYNSDSYAKARSIELLSFPDGNSLIRQDVEANAYCWGYKALDKELILKAGKHYRILIKVPNDQAYFYGDVSKTRFSNQGITFRSARYTDDMIEMFETKSLSEFPDIEYKILK